jgi:hypothetical protein
VVFAQLPGRGPIAKAATNARGLVFDQIGGVFTLPRYRGLGVGRAVVEFLLSGLSKPTSLFVKQHNQAAIRMYARLGYVVEDPFTISYY